MLLKLFVLLSQKEVIMNRLEDLLALNFCAQFFSVWDILMDGFKTEQSKEKKDP